MYEVDFKRAFYLRNLLWKTCQHFNVDAAEIDLRECNWKQVCAFCKVEYKCESNFRYSICDEEYYNSDYYTIGWVHFSDFYDCLGCDREFDTFGINSVER